MLYFSDQSGFASVVNLDTNQAERPMSPKEQTVSSDVPSLERDARDDLHDAAVVEMAAKRLREQGTALTAGEFEPLTDEEWDRLFRLHAARR
jgi:hypothetical protein